MRSLSIILLAAALLAGWAGQPPAVQPATAPAGTFSAARAFDDIRMLAASPRPVGSAAHDAAAGHLSQRLRALGFEVREQLATRKQHALRNLIALRPGTDPSLEPIVLMAHYDSVPGSPGAGDDAAGVATALEVARALAATGPALRPLALVFTDGEESGLLGARAFYDEDPLASRLGPVLNMEARGGGGRVLMFETGERAGGLVDLYRHATHGPTANSLTVFVYRHMPNDTDFTVVREHGGTGLNYAFIGREVDYHSPTATAARLDARTVQHLGEQVLPVARALLGGTSLPPPATDLVYSDVLGAFVIAYAPTVGWAPLALAAGALLLATRKARQTSACWRCLARGAACSLGVVLLAALVAWVTGEIDGVPHGQASHLRLLPWFDGFEVALALGALGAALLMGSLAGCHRAGSWPGALWLALLVALALQALAPTTAFLVAWPLLVAVASLLLLQAAPRRSARALVALAAAVALAQCLVIGHGVLLVVGANLPMAVALFAWLGSLSLWPWLDDPLQRRRGALAGAALLLAGWGVALGVRWQY